MFGYRWHEILIVVIRSLTFLTPLKITQSRIYFTKINSVLKEGIKRLKRNRTGKLNPAGNKIYDK